MLWPLWAKMKVIFTLLISVQGEKIEEKLESVRDVKDVKELKDQEEVKQICDRCFGFQIAPKSRDQTKWYIFSHKCLSHKGPEKHILNI